MASTVVHRLRQCVYSLGLLTAAAAVSSPLFSTPSVGDLEKRPRVRGAFEDDAVSTPYLTHKRRIGQMDATRPGLLKRRAPGVCSPPSGWSA